MNKILAAILGDSWKTSLLGYAQFIVTASVEAYQNGQTNWGKILLSAVIALIARQSADSSQVKKNQ
jgi:hypothetical protein